MEGVRTENREAWMRVGEAIAARRSTLGLSQAEAAVRAGISEPAWQVIERTRQVRYRERTLRGVCRALGWRDDAIDQILAGGDPALEIEVVHEVAPGVYVAPAQRVASASSEDPSAATTQAETMARIVAEALRQVLREEGWQPAKKPRTKKE